MNVARTSVARALWLVSNVIHALSVLVDPED